ncbi:MAG: hypothetical protein J3K34DRAFT_460831 [Monoraphidium minutum]|nr:MAG: hypothetical protein J3K34DRAFT_460831 [Monoraphidium minutum]
MTAHKAGSPGAGGLLRRLAVLALLAAASAADAPVAIVPNVLIGDTLYDISAILIPYADMLTSNILTQQPWWGNETLGRQGATAVQMALGEQPYINGGNIIGAYFALSPFLSSLLHIATWQNGALLVGYFVNGLPGNALFALATPSGTGDPHLQAFTGQRFDFCMAGCEGRAYAMLSSAKTQANAELNRLPGADAFPAAGTWMTGLGLRYGPDFSLSLRMRTDIDFKIVQTEGVWPPPMGGRGPPPTNECTRPRARANVAF